MFLCWAILYSSVAGVADGSGAIDLVREFPAKINRDERFDHADEQYLFGRKPDVIFCRIGTDLCEHINRIRRYIFVPNIRYDKETF